MYQAKQVTAIKGAKDGKYRRVCFVPDVASSNSAGYRTVIIWTDYGSVVQDVRRSRIETVPADLVLA